MPLSFCTDEALLVVAQELARRLSASGRKLVLAESCTAGLTAAQLARVPGVSANFCGSAVVYRETTKTAWLGVPASNFQNDGPGVVSGATAEAMARGVLAQTPEADIAVAITGHLGPGAPPELDGVTFHGWAIRDGDVGSRRHQLPGFTAAMTGNLSERELRQRYATWQILQTACSVVAESRGLPQFPAI